MVETMRLLYYDFRQFFVYTIFCAKNIYSVVTQSESFITPNQRMQNAESRNDIIHRMRTSQRFSLNASTMVIDLLGQN